MLPSELRSNTGMRIALAALAVSTVLFIGSAIRAFHIEDPGTATMADALEIPRARTVAQTTERNDNSRIDDDPFSPERIPPASPYRLPGAAPEVDSKAATPVVLGTVISTDGKNFATCRIGNEQPKSVRVGDQLGGFTVRSIERGHVVFTTPSGGRLDVRTTYLRN